MTVGGPAVLKDKVLKELETRIDALKHKDKDKDAERKVIDEVFDQSTLLTIYKMFTDEIIDTVEFSISTGKEANVFFATSSEGPRVVKIFRTTITTFKTIQKYIFGDPRFKNIKGDRRRMIFQWASKEFKNLNRARNAGVRVPEAFICKNNVLIMEYLGTEDSPAPLLRECQLDDIEGTFDDLVLQIRKLYHSAGLVHSDLSEYNILMHEESPYLIDMGQSVLRAHPMSKEFMDRDIKNLYKYFKRKGLKVDQKKVHERLMEPI